MSQAAIDNANDPKNFPRWAQACPKSFEALKQSLARAAAALHRFHMGPTTQQEVAIIMGHVAATCFAAGRASVREAGFDVADPGPPEKIVS